MVKGEASKGKLNLLPYSKGMNLNFHKPLLQNGQILVIPPKDVTIAECTKWENTLVSQFAVQKLNFHAVKAITTKLWSNYGLLEVLSIENRYYFFKFSNYEAAEKVLENGTWHMSNRPLVLKKWMPNLTLFKEELQSIPLWIKLCGVPIEYWSSDGLSYIASAVGIPLYSNRNTALRKRIDYA